MIKYVAALLLACTAAAVTAPQPAAAETVRTRQEVREQSQIGNSALPHIGAGVSKDDAKAPPAAAKESAGPEKKAAEVAEKSRKKLEGAALPDGPAAQGPGVKSAPAPQVVVEITKAQPAKKTAPPKAKAAVQERKIGINLASRMLILYENGKKVRMYHIGVGTTSTPTPPGFYKVQTKEVNPTWIDPGDTTIQIPSGPDNPLGYRWIGFSGNYGIHGTNAPWSVGYYVSNGCIRMREPDVEELYNLVSIGTPVTVYYDRIVIDSLPDHTVSYYIYPDGYGWQNLTVADVKRALKGYGVDNFVSAADIERKIAASDGEPTYVAKAYDLFVNGRKLPLRALKKDGVTYIPAVATASALRLDLHWDGSRRVLTSPYGKAPGVVKSDVVYVSAAYIGSLFRLSGTLTADWKYKMDSLPAAENTGVSVTISSRPAENGAARPVL